MKEISVKELLKIGACVGPIRNEAQYRDLVPYLEELGLMWGSGTNIRECLIHKERFPNEGLVWGALSQDMDGRLQHGANNASRRQRISPDEFKALMRGIFIGIKPEEEWPAEADHVHLPGTRRPIFRTADFGDLYGEPREKVAHVNVHRRHRVIAEAEIAAALALLERAGKIENGRIVKP